jgi:alkaline phosphatase
MTTAMLSYANGPGYRAGGRPDLTNVDTTALEFLQEATVPMAVETHAGEDVALFARGPSAHTWCTATRSRPSRST